jgi:alpha-beta hydrolase superfamily lysophospholipase
VGRLVGKRWAQYLDGDLDRIRDETLAAIDHHESVTGWLADPRRAHVDRPVTRRDTRSGLWRGLRFERVTFDAGYLPQSDEPGGRRWLEHVPNHLGEVRLFRHVGAPRPWVICVHGTGMGIDAMDLYAFDVAWLHEHLGLNVALPVLPLSASRRRPGGARVQFPTIDQLDSFHGFVQATAELRAIVAMLRDRGAPEITVYGVSLGGYVVSLAAAVVPGVDRVIAGIPATDMQRLYLENVPEELRGSYHPLLEAGRRLHRIVSPMDLPPRVPHDQRFVYAAVADRMVPARAHARPLWEAWGRPSSCWFPGGHVSFARSPRVRSFVRGALSRPLVAAH